MSRQLTSREDLQSNGADEYRMKMTALRHHVTAKELYQTMQIPYRVALDHLKNHKEGHPVLNPCYPYPGYLVDCTPWVYFPEDFIIGNPNRKRVRERYIEGVDILKPHRQEEVEEITEPCRKIKDKLGETWQQYLAFLLVGYDFTTFTEFDFTGDTGKLPIEDIALLQKVYERIQRGYLERNTGIDYLTKEPNNPNYGTYQAQPFRVQNPNGDTWQQTCDGIELPTI